jgi:hypothetical protein
MSTPSRVGGRAEKYATHNTANSAKANVATVEMSRHKGLYKHLVQAVLRSERVTSEIFKKYLQCVLAARILTVDLLCVLL